VGVVHRETCTKDHLGIGGGEKRGKGSIGRSRVMDKGYCFTGRGKDPRQPVGFHYGGGSHPKTQKKNRIEEAHSEGEGEKKKQLL